MIKGVETLVSEMVNIIKVTHLFFNPKFHTGKKHKLIETITSQKTVKMVNAKKNSKKKHGEFSNKEVSSLLHIDI